MSGHTESSRWKKINSVSLNSVQVSYRRSERNHYSFSRISTHSVCHKYLSLFAFHINIFSNNWFKSLNFRHIRETIVSHCLQNIISLLLRWIEMQWCNCVKDDSETALKSFLCKEPLFLIASIPPFFFIFLRRVHFSVHFINTDIQTLVLIYYFRYLD